ncbi:RNA polymerase sigma-70 factor, ECF subfamily [Parapedobacter indicus]|uniref:RNA polymerase sigma-70 factor, ECF subfamily n=2 Tax=Parapedobacter indicus TaxID=1477437 RepID=A0A1I3IZ71_9SPHI|nr:RNA polymerase sigma-70 factor (ECF subfamily) [Parapedobacter indicus]SFI53292.1 RNA polymerase sigma-70 factor, ECF subfamily [Parapedobacter indicus]
MKIVNFPLCAFFQKRKEFLSLRLFESYTMEDFSHYTDPELLRLLEGGDTRAMTEIYDRYWLLLYRHALRMLHSEEEAEDILQDTFSTLWGRVGDLNLVGTLSAFLYGMLRNKVLNRLAYHKVREDHLRSLGAFEESGEVMPDQLLRDKELARIIEEEISRLPGKMRAIFELRHREELSYKEIAEQLKVTEHTVRKQVSNALHILRNRLRRLGLSFSTLRFLVAMI